jgi:hypothetical protein
MGPVVASWEGWSVKDKDDKDDKDSKLINDVFDYLDKCRYLPTFELERRADVFFAVQMKKIFAGFKPEETVLDILPEFPISNLDKKSRACRVDYAVLTLITENSETAENAENAKNAQNPEDTETTENAQNAKNAQYREDTETAENAQNAKNTKKKQLYYVELKTNTFPANYRRYRDQFATMTNPKNIDVHSVIQFIITNHSKKRGRSTGRQKKYDDFMERLEHLELVRQSKGGVEPYTFHDKIDLFNSDAKTVYMGPEPSPEFLDEFKGLEAITFKMIIGFLKSAENESLTARFVKSLGLWC